MDLGPKKKERRKERKKKNVRGLSIAEETFLLLELLDLTIVRGLSDQGIDVKEVALGGNVETSVLLSDTVTL